MRKLLLLFLCASFMWTANIQTASAQGFDAKKVYLDLGVGFPRYSFGTNIFGIPGYGYGYGYTSNSYRTPSFNMSIRYGFNEFISGGLYAGYAHNGWSYVDGDGFDHNNRNTYIPVGVGASFHVWAFLNNKLDLGLGVEKLDLYVTLVTGAQIRMESEKRPTYTTTDTRVRPFVGSMVGARYFFINNIGAFVEFGYGMNSYVTGGVTFKF